MPVLSTYAYPNVTMLRSVLQSTSALDDLEDDEDFATAGTDDRLQGVGDAQGIKAMEVITFPTSTCHVPCT